MNSNAWYQHVVELDAPTLHFGGANDGILHNPIAGISVLAGNFGQFGLENGLTGAIYFDEVIVINPLQCELHPFSDSLDLPPAGKSNLMADLGVAIHFPIYPNYIIDTAALDGVRRAGFSWVRMDLFWSDIERKPGVYNFANFDALLAVLETRGLKALFILAYSNTLHADCPPGHPPNIVLFTVRNRLPQSMRSATMQRPPPVILPDTEYAMRCGMSQISPRFGSLFPTQTIILLLLVKPLTASMLATLPPWLRRPVYLHLISSFFGVS